MPSPDLTWSTLLDQRGIHAPVLAVGPAGDARRLVLSNLASEKVGQGARVLWLGSQRVARPLAWMPLAEQRLDARPLRPSLGERPWPTVNPFRLEPSYAGRWLADRLDVAGPGDHEILGRAVGEVLGYRAGTLRRWRPPRLEEGLRGLLAVVPDRFHSGLDALAEEVAGREEEADELRFDDADLTVLCGHREDLEDRREAAALAILSFVTEAGRDDRRDALVVVEDWLDWVGPDGRTLVADALLDLAERPEGGVVLASTRPAGWTDDRAGRRLLSAVTAVSVARRGGCPDSWRAPELPSCDGDASRTAFVLTRGKSPRWARHHLPRPAVSAA